jgi:hypothetical protein
MRRERDMIMMIAARALMRFSLTDAYPMLREVAEQNAHRDRKAVFAKAGGDQ